MTDNKPLLDEANERAERASNLVEDYVGALVGLTASDLVPVVDDVRWINAELAAEVRRLQAIIDPPPVTVDLGPLTLDEVASLRAIAEDWRDKAVDPATKRDVWLGLLAKIEAATA